MDDSVEPSGDNSNSRLAALLDGNPPRPPIVTTAIAEPPSARWREPLAVALILVLCDLTIYRGHGFAGYALLFAAAPLLLAFGSPRPRGGASVWIVGAMLLLLAVKLLWCGSGLLVATGFALIAAFAAALAGLCPYVIEVAVLASQTIVAGYEGIVFHWRTMDKRYVPFKRTKWLNITLPLGAIVAFGLLFILANPNLVASFGRGFDWLCRELQGFLEQFSPSVWEVLFWVAVFWITLGLLRPLIGRTQLFEQMSRRGPAAADQGETPSPAPLYSAFRNMLVTVILLFAVYLAFEFHTLWFHDFEPGFYYSGYAHEGAAWLTVALALATAILSLVFRGRVLADARLPRLRRLAWVWSLENMLLAVAVYHRLSIYIGFNGMTRMRMVGIFGMTAVVIGFVLVVWKIVHNRDVVWLMRRHLWTVAIMVYLFALTPVDTIVTRYNVNRILSGDPAPSVQLCYHPINSEGVMLLTPLLGCDDKTIREGIGAMLAQRQAEAESTATRRRNNGWTAYQMADEIALQSLTSAEGNWAEYSAAVGRCDAAIRHFREYSYQWY